MRVWSREKQTRVTHARGSQSRTTLFDKPSQEWIRFVGKAAILSFGFFLISCTDPFATVETKDIDANLAELLNVTLDQARSSPGSAAIRGQLAMTYDVNGFPDAALTTYSQAEQLDPGTFAWPYFQAMLLAKRNDPENAIVAMDLSLIHI